MKRIVVEWSHLEVAGTTCDRCTDTGEALREAVAALDAECTPKGVHVVLEETALGPEAVAESNRIRIDGRPLESLLPDARSGQSGCTSCDDLLDARGTQCRTIECGPLRHEAVPASLVREAVCRVAGCCG
ncbi:MAG TPA: DUF2703 domain-containing protein [Gammaproteobacteria bacterium]|nr:DUF2703 domain-containing protein [Gammaproteobacteria bacterium]